MIEPSREIVEHDTKLALADAWTAIRAAVDLQPDPEVRMVLHGMLDKKFEAQVEEIVEERFRRG